MHTVTTFVQHSTGSLSQRNQARKINKRHLRKQEVKLSMFAEDMLLYVENPEDATKKLLELVNDFNKVA